jgi:hypothetical protein
MLAVLNFVLKSSSYGSEELSTVLTVLVIVCVRCPSAKLPQLCPTNPSLSKARDGVPTQSLTILPFTDSLKGTPLFCRNMSRTVKTLYQ